MQGIGLIFKVLWSPGEAMFEISKSPRILAPLLFMMLFSVITGMAIMSKIDFAEMTLRTIERSRQGANMTEEQKELLRRNMNLPIVKGFTFASTIVTPILLILFVTLIYFVVFTLLGREGSFKAFFSITAFSFIPSIFRGLATVITAFVIPPASLMLDELGSLSPSTFLDRDAVSPVLFTAVNMIDVVTIWILALLVIGYGFVTRKSMSKTTRTIAVVSVFMIYACLRLVSAAIRGV